MRHADEGLLHAWLDGALVGEEAETIRQHLALCANCRARLDEAARLREEADAILAGATPLDLPRPPFAEVVAQARALAAEAHLPPPRLHFAPARTTSWRAFAWAASLFLALSLGWWGRGLLRRPPRLADSARDNVPLLLKLEPFEGMSGAEPLSAPAQGGAAARAPGQPGPLAAAAPASSRSFQALAAPSVAPAEVPAPSPIIIVGRGADYTGEGIDGWRSWSNDRIARIAAENVEAAPTFTPYTVAPELQNRDEVRRALQRAYPPMLRDAGIGGTTIVWVLIDEKGTVLRSLVRKSSRSAVLDRAALQVARVMRFSPAYNRDVAVKVWVQVPVVFLMDPWNRYRPPEQRLAQAEVEPAPAPTATRPAAEEVARAAANRADAGASVMPAAPAPAEPTTRTMALRGDTAAAWRPEALTVAGYGNQQQVRQVTGEPRRIARVPGGAALTQGIFLLEGLPVIAFLPTTPDEVSHVLQRTPAGDTLEVVATLHPTLLDQFSADSARRAAVKAPAPARLSTLALRPGVNTATVTQAQGTVTIAGALPQDSLRPLLRRVHFVPREK